MTKKILLGFSTIILLLELLFTVYVNYIDFIDFQIITSNSLISDKSVTIIFKEDNVPPLSELIEHYPGVTILSELRNFADLRVWGLCGNCFLDNNTNSLINGTFFEKDDFFKKDFKAVVGTNILYSDNCFLDKKGKKYFKFNNNNYEVIGVISSDISDMLDNTVFVNLDSFNIQCLNKFIIDSTDKQLIADTINNIKQEYDIDIIKENDNFIERYIFNDVDENILTVLITIFISILVITLSMFTLRYYNEEIKVKRIIGISFKRILFDLFKYIVFLTVINTSFFATIYIIIYYNVLKNIHLNFYFFHLIIFSCIVFIIIYLIIYLYIIVSNKFFYKNGVK